MWEFGPKLLNFQYYNRDKIWMVVGNPLEFKFRSLIKKGNIQAMVRTSLASPACGPSACNLLVYIHDN